MKSFNISTFFLLTTNEQRLTSLRLQRRGTWNSLGQFLPGVAANVKILLDGNHNDPSFELTSNPRREQGH